MILAGHAVAMVTYCVAIMIMITTCSPMIGLLSDTMIDPSKVLEGTGNCFNHVKVVAIN